MANRIQLRRDTAANWTRVNPVLEDGEPGLEIDTNYVKYGDGNTPWVELAYASTGGGGSVSFDYSTVQEGTVGFSNVTSITGNTNTGVSLTSDEWAQLMWVPDTDNITIANIVNGPATYNWAYVDDSGFIVESNVSSVRSTWKFHANSLLTTPGNVQVGNVGSYGSISFVDTISANNYVFANGISILSGISGNTGNITFDGIKIIGANIGNGSGDIELIPDNTGDFYANGQYVHIYPTRAVPDSPHIHIDSGYGGDLILGDDQRGVDINHDSNVYIRTDQYAGAYNWQFGSDGNLTLPNGKGIIGAIETAASVDLYGDSTSQFVQLNYNNTNFVYVDVNGAHMQAGPSAPGEYEIFLSTDGSTTFPDHMPVTITGNLTVGNLTVNGNSSIINTESYVVADNIIQMANANPADTLDLGFVAHRTVDSTLEHTGLVRDADAGIWRLFSNVTAQPGSTVDFTDADYDVLQVGGLNTAAIAATGPVNFTASPPAYSTPGIQWNSGFQSDIYGNTQVAAYLVDNPQGSTYSNTNVASYLSSSTLKTVANLVVSGSAPGSVTGSAGDTAGMIRVDSNYVYYCTSTFSLNSYTVGWAGATSNNVFIVKGDYPTPQVGWIVSYDIYTFTADTVTDAGANWQITYTGTPYGSPGGGTATLTNPDQPAIWKTVPLSEFQTAVNSTYSNANVVANLQNFVTSISTTANIRTTANVIAPNFLFANGVNILSTVSGSYGNTQVAAYLLTYANANVSNLNNTSGNITTLVATNFSSGNIRVSGGYISALTNAAVTSATLTTAAATNFSTANAVISGGYISGVANIAITTGGNISGVGNIIGSTANTTVTAGDYTTSFLSNGLVTLANVASSGNIAALNFTGNGYQLTSVATKVTGSWTLAAGANSVNITVPGPGTYALWVNGNIPNGICTYTATVVVTNTNVPVLGSQYAWYYLAGNNLVITSIPAHIVGTAGSIITTAPTTTTAYVFEFGITNNSGASCTVEYGYTKLS